MYLVIELKKNKSLQISGCQLFSYRTRLACSGPPTASDRSRPPFHSMGCPTHCMPRCFWRHHRRHPTYWTCHRFESCHSLSDSLCWVSAFRSTAGEWSCCFVWRAVSAPFVASFQTLKGSFCFPRVEYHFAPLSWPLPPPAASVSFPDISIAVY